MSDEKLTPDQELDLFLERLLPLDSKREYDHGLATLAEELQIGKADDGRRRDGDPINRKLWKAATGYGGFKYKAAEGRKWRAGLEFTYVEIMLIGYATTVISKGVMTRPNKALICQLLQRPYGEVEAACNRYGPAHGRQGFGLTKPPEENPEDDTEVAE